MTFAQFFLSLGGSVCVYVSVVMLLVLLLFDRGQCCCRFFFRLFDVITKKTRLPLRHPETTHTAATIATGKSEVFKFKRLQIAILDDS